LRLYLAIRPTYDKDAAFVIDIALIPSFNGDEESPGRQRLLLVGPAQNGFEDMTVGADRQQPRLSRAEKARTFGPPRAQRKKKLAQNARHPARERGVASMLQEV
jgi:hypothetical protein